MTDDLVGQMKASVTYEYMPMKVRRQLSEAAARIEALEGALRSLIATYDGMETGDGEPCPDIAAARKLFPPHPDRAALTKDKSDG